MKWQLRWQHHKISREIKYLLDDDDNDDSDQEFAGEKLLLRYLKMKLSTADSVAGVRKEVAPNLWQAIRVTLSLDGIQFMLPMERNVQVTYIKTLHYGFAVFPVVKLASGIIIVQMERVGCSSVVEALGLQSNGHGN